eukprot:Seg32.4 transcript_id=Seg32.4/GoldUCD/mRNA.D3Y31 product="SUMO-activating enzyme subunit 2" protein_id=Seg32.4/GoldUCD/D3Y31
MAGEVLGQFLAENISQSKVLVVGAGGIGCELLKNLALTGFPDINVIDLDTIDVSNLNRQFLFQKKHVGKSKAMVAKEIILSMRPDINVTAFHDNVMNPDYNTDFFKRFTLVMNALDNKAARNHVNRMCLAADVPLVESGSAGYLGQVTVIKKGFSECYECQPKPAQKTYPGCTIRNTPSEPVHCIVWSKHLFSQLFGEADADAEVSPDTEDPELNEGQNTDKKSENNDEDSSEIKRRSTRKWAEEVNYDPERLFTKFFFSDVNYLLSMDKLWKKRRPPTPLPWKNALNSENEEFIDKSTINDNINRVWSVKECAEIFGKCLENLQKKLESSREFLVWDKDDEIAMDFVAAASNIRSHIFGIPMKSRFTIKSMAGNIIPAIATTNAIISGLIVMEALKILSGNIKKCKSVFLSKQARVKKRLLVTSTLVPPNPKCYVCAPKPEVTVHLNVNKVTVKIFEDKVLKERFGMVAPDVEIDDGKGTILISSEEGETEVNNEKTLSVFKITNGTRLKADDFLQNYELVVTVRQRESKDPDELFLVEGEANLPPSSSRTSLKDLADSESTTSVKGMGSSETSNTAEINITDEMEVTSTSGIDRKRKHTDEDEAQSSDDKKSKVENDDIIVL